MCGLRTSGKTQSPWCLYWMTYLLKQRRLPRKRRKARRRKRRKNRPCPSRHSGLPGMWGRPNRPPTWRSPGGAGCLAVMIVNLEICSIVEQYMGVSHKLICWISPKYLVISPTHVVYEVGLFCQWWDQSDHADPPGHVLAGEPRSWWGHCEIDVTGLVDEGWHGRGSSHENVQKIQKFAQLP